MAKPIGTTRAVLMSAVRIVKATIAASDVSITEE
jgi:hypothetical protein